MTEQGRDAIQSEFQTDGSEGLPAAAQRLDRAVSRLEAKLAERLASAGDSGAFAEDRARLAAALDASRARERALEQVAADASEALGRAAAEVRAALAAELVEDTNDASPPQGPGS